MGSYRLFVYNQNGQVVAPAKAISAANDSEAIAQAETIHGSFAAELLDFDSLRIVKYLPGNVSALSRAAEPRSPLVLRPASPARPNGHAGSLRPRVIPLDFDRSSLK
jgi:hypothetical protein